MDLFEYDFKKIQQEKTLTDMMYGLDQHSTTQKEQEIDKSAYAFSQVMK